MVFYDYYIFVNICCSSWKKKIYTFNYIEYKQKVLGLCKLFIFHVMINYNYWNWRKWRTHFNTYIFKYSFQHISSGIVLTKHTKNNILSNKIWRIFYLYTSFILDSEHIKKYTKWTFYIFLHMQFLGRISSKLFTSTYLFSKANAIKMILLGCQKCNSLSNF